MIAVSRRAVMDSRKIRIEMNSGTSQTSSLKRFIKGIPFVWLTAARIAGRLNFPGSGSFWENEYREGRTSGPGSYGRLAEFKAEILNEFVRTKNIRTVIEFGCG